MAYTKEGLEKLSLHNLREIGRARGVKSPTGLTKEKLIQNILDIESGKIAPCKFSKVGRPTLQKEKVINYPEILDMEKLNRIKEVIRKCERDIMAIILE